MKTVDLGKEKLGLNKLIGFAQQEPVLILTSDGEEYILSQADDFEKEVEALRNNPSFLKFLDERSKCGTQIPLSEIEKEIAQEQSKGKPAA